MPISRFDRPADSNVVNTYTPIPFDQMMQAGQIMAQQHDRAADALQKVYDDTYNLRYISDSKDERYIKEGVIPAAKDVFNKYISEDLGNPVVLRQAMSEMKNKIDWNKVKDIQESYGGWAENQKWRQQLKAKGQYAKYLDSDDLGYDTETMGIYSKLTPAALDFRKKAETYFDNWKGDSYIKDGVVYEGVRGKAGAKKITSGVLQSFLESPEGLQKMQELASRGITGVDAHGAAEAYLMDVGKEYYTTGNIGFVPGYKGKDSDNPNSKLFSAEQLPMVDVPGSRLSSDKFLGKDIMRKIPRSTTRGGIAGPTMELEEVPTGKRSYKESLLEKDEVKRVISILPKEYQEANKRILNGESTEEDKAMLFSKLEDVYKGLEGNIKKGVYFNAFDNETRKAQTEHILGSTELKKANSGLIANRKVYDLKTGISYSDGETAWEEIVTEELAKGGGAGFEPQVHITGYLFGNNPFSHPTLGNDPAFRRGFVMSVNGRNLIVSGPPSTNQDIMADQTYQEMTTVPGIEISDSTVPGLTQLYDGNKFTFKMNGKEVYSSPDFDDAYYNTAKKLTQSNK